MEDFRRKAYETMLDWKNHLADRYALLVEGARRVGKTHLIKRFASQGDIPSHTGRLEHAREEVSHNRLEQHRTDAPL